MEFYKEGYEEVVTVVIRSRKELSVVGSSELSSGGRGGNSGGGAGGGGDGNGKLVFSEGGYHRRGAMVVDGG